jgi:5-deoxy-glucuronate isomerase
MHHHVIGQKAPFPSGFTPITRIGEATRDTGISFGILRLAAGERFERRLDRETAVLLMDGSIRATVGAAAAEAARASLFDEAPTALHAPRGFDVSVVAATACELALLEVENDRSFGPRIFDRHSMVQNEHRGKGTLDDASYRIVRTIFDTRNRPEANLVLGEVITLPGRWSSYPPHHHPQPEIYHYRFAHPAGFGFSEVGEDVARTRHGDTLVIPPGADHAQVAAPGYPMYYLWAIRHLPGNPYVTPEFTQAHRWLLEPGVAVWRPQEDPR